MGKRWMLFREMECGDSHRPQRFRSLAACYRFPLKSPQLFLFQHPSSHWELQSYLGGRECKLAFHGSIAAASSEGIAGSG